MSDVVGNFICKLLEGFADCIKLLIAYDAGKRERLISGDFYTLAFNHQICAFFRANDQVSAFPLVIP